MEKRFGPTAPSAATHDEGCIFLVDTNGVRVVIKPLLTGQPDHELADKLLKIINGGKASVS